jgi:hypothetical protein
MRRLIPVWWTGLIVAVAAGGTALAADAPGKAARRTGHDQYEAVSNFNRRTLVGAYDRAGRRDPKWDAPARALLEVAAKWFTSSSVPSFYLPEPPPEPAALLDLARRAADAGCDDPLVAYCHAVALAPSNPAEALPILRKAAGGLTAGDYPPNRVHSGTASRCSAAT